MVIGVGVGMSRQSASLGMTLQAELPQVSLKSRCHAGHAGFLHRQTGCTFGQSEVLREFGSKCLLGVMLSLIKDMIRSHCAGILPQTQK